MLWDSVADAARHLTRCYRQLGEPWLARRIAPWATRMDVELTGCCCSATPGGRARMTARSTSTGPTMQLPPDLADYVLVHELAHLRRRDHSQDFWRPAKYPDWLIEIISPSLY
jgi:hypothetical protein